MKTMSWSPPPPHTHSSEHLPRRGCGAGPWDPPGPGAPGLLAIKGPSRVRAPPGAQARGECARRPRRLAALGVFPQIWSPGRGRGAGGGPVTSAGGLRPFSPPAPAAAPSHTDRSRPDPPPPRTTHSTQQHGEQRPFLWHEPRGAVQDREEVRRGSGGAPSGVDRDAVRVRRGPPRPRTPGLPGLAEERRDPEQVGEQPASRWLQAGEGARQPALHGVQADGAGGTVPEGR